MKARIVRIGNSQGIRIPKPLIAQTGLKGEVDISVRENRLVISPAERPRANWAEAFRSMARLRDDILLDSELVSGSSWDEEGWEWK
ncbi:MAG: AbrB/MazE/SpoVT family DNA-binding domain-containing protein [Candidatus Eisenbacteria bacterium]|nr:AbrB/MazE/SpoVT family DNA-binding domain-containing protein [Candidatus Eisenbacteria bacterium]